VSGRPCLRATAALITLALALAIGASVAVAGAIAPGSTIADSARLAAGGRTLQVGGVVRCNSCRGFTLGATVSQRGSGAIAQGGVRCACHGSAEHWLLTARSREGTTFRPGQARICVWVTARSDGGDAIDARQWCENVKLTLPGS
jgi:hypothetical protein